MKTYEKIGWLDHVQDIETGEVIQEGTPVSQVNMNHMDEGIFTNREAAILHEAQIADAQKEIKVLKDALGLNSVNTLKITVTDGKGGTAYRRVTFKRTNSAPTISGQDKALGLKNGSFAENYTVSDVEGDNVVVTEFVDDVQIRSYQATLGQQETIELTREKWLSLTNGQHQLRIEAVDGNFATSVRVFSFSKKETVIKFELVAPEETDAAATKVLVTPTWKIEGAVAKVEACNNGFDAVPTWEDITAMVQINRVYNFTNKTKTASKWGVNIRFTITKNEGFEGEVSISGFGGAYE